MESSSIAGGGFVSQLHAEALLQKRMQVRQSIAEILLVEGMDDVQLQ